MPAEARIPRIDIPRSSVPQEAAEGRTIVHEQGGQYKDITLTIIDHLANQAEVEGLRGMILWESEFAGYGSVTLSYILDGEEDAIGAGRFRSIARSHVVLNREISREFGRNLNYRIARCGDDFDGFVQNATRQKVKTPFGIHTPVAVLKFT